VGLGSVWELKRAYARRIRVTQLGLALEQMGSEGAVEEMRRVMEPKLSVGHR
jgi:hypothetical protein